MQYDIYTIVYSKSKGQPGISSQARSHKYEGLFKDQTPTSKTGRHPRLGENACPCIKTRIHLI